MEPLNYYENQIIDNSALPVEWRSKEARKELLEFLQSNWEQRQIFYKDGVNEGKQQFLTPEGLDNLKTRGYIGTIAYKGLQINIFPKIFRRTPKDDIVSGDIKHLIYNLVCWLEYIDKVDFPFIRISSEVESSDNLLSLLISLYVRYVKAAIDYSLYFSYEDQVDDLQTVRGRLDINDYLTHKYPNGKHDSFRCEYSTYEFDNLLNRIIKCTLSSLLKNKNTTDKNKIIIRSLLMKLGEVGDMRCTPRDCDKIKLTKMQARYKIVLSMSKIFLLNQTTNYSIDSHDSFCFLFPANLLFEGFIYGYFKQAFGNIANVRRQAEKYLIKSTSLGDKNFPNKFKMQYDILVKYQGVDFIFDTKYKMLSRFENNSNFAEEIVKEVNSPDLYQILAYAVSQGAEKVFLLYPLFRFEDLEPYPAILEKTVFVDNQERTVQIRIVRLPFVFEEGNDVTKENIKKVLSQCLGIS